MTVVLVVAVLGAVLCWPRRRAARERLVGVTVGRSNDVREPPSVRRSVMVAAGLAVTTVFAAGGAWWWAAVLVVAGLVGARVRPMSAAAPEDIALTADLMAACMSAGAGMAEALAAATAATEGRLQAHADRVVDALRRGSPPEQVWAGWLADEQLAPLARSCVRASSSGAAIAAELARVAARIRTRRRAAVQERVARASVWVVLPLGLCFLPAFVVVGVVPLVVGLLHTLR